MVEAGTPTCVAIWPAGQTMWGVTHQKPEDGQTVFLGQGSKGFDSFFFFHISIIAEIKKCYKRAFCAPDL